MNVIKIAALAVLMMSTSACFGRDERPRAVVVEHVVVIPEKKYFVCEEVPLPNPDTLSNTQIANLINDLVKANRTCKNNMNGVELYLNSAKQVLEERKKLDQVE